MAFATQRAFLNVPFHSEHPQLPERKRSDCQLKSYESCTDSRAWAMDRMVSSQFLLDVAHKSRFRRVLPRPEGDFELSRDYLLHLATEDLVDFVMSLMIELKKTKTQMRRLEESRNDLDHQLASVLQIVDTCEQEREELILEQRQSTVFDPNDTQQELKDLKVIIGTLREKAEKHDSLAEENLCLKAQIQTMCTKTDSNARRGFGKGDCVDSCSVACAKLRAELCIYKTQYEDLKQQKRALMEQLERFEIGYCKVPVLKSQLVQEEIQRKLQERQLEDLRIQCDRQVLDLKRKDSYISMCNQRLREVELYPGASVPVKNGSSKRKSR